MDQSRGVPRPRRRRERLLRRAARVERVWRGSRAGKKLRTRQQLESAGPVDLTHISDDDLTANRVDITDTSKDELTIHRVDCTDSSENKLTVDRRTHLIVPRTSQNVTFKGIEKTQLIDDASEVCVIDLERIWGGDLAVRLPCMHIFHQRCIMPYLHRQRDPRCPIDRIPIERQSLPTLPVWKVITGKIASREGRERMTTDTKAGAMLQVSGIFALYIIVCVVACAFAFGWNVLGAVLFAAVFKYIEWGSV